MAKKKRPCHNCDLARKTLRELLKLTCSTKEDGEVRLFSEAGLYDCLGKDLARTVLSILSNIAEQLGIRDICRPDSGPSDPTDFNELLWRIRDSVSKADSDLRRFWFMAGDIEKGAEFHEAVNFRRRELETHVKEAQYTTPENTLRHVLGALGFDRKTGELDLSWLKKEKR
jgi:hypothetical protein